ncbi:MAG: acyl-ACP--UDP-N-acetylglucosamine O-acyltransferase [Bacteroidales bacterium]|jgi:UDP-N-acetylglucosamine acyltransferase|nr:acyl-ACP--UDP-N-acetylglucosamine O-acyltransferase [Bacteroidales bacterium]MDD4385400.1 acyl-ACP--UDP-N-acetylglucosamine O-acyltransferase [Bacteroidales bacterium]MDY0197165.1 acyl-ACP--UDP-N-acetylglucosamine O-acyltransferase [Tenuifilaceae bacterium]
MNQSLAYIHPKAKIGKNVKIEPFAYVAEDVEIGDNTWIGPNATVLDGARIGSNCKVFPGAVVSGIPQDLKFKGESTTAIIGDNTVLRECVTVNRGTASKGYTKVGSNCLIMAYVHVAHDCVIGDNVILGNSVQLAGEVEIDHFAILSGGCLVHQFERIGAHVMVQGGSKVNKDIPPYARVGRDPIVFVGLNTIGLRRRKFDSDQVAEIQEIYRIIYSKGLNVSQAITEIENTMPKTEERDQILNFVRNSSRGIVRGPSSTSSVEDDD